MKKEQLLKKVYSWIDFCWRKRLTEKLKDCWLMIDFIHGDLSPLYYRKRKEHFLSIISNVKDEEIKKELKKYVK